MTQVYVYQNADLGNKVIRLGSIANISTSAERGVVATSTIELDDTAGTLIPPPFFGFLWYETAAAQPIVWGGYGSNRAFQRVDSLITGAQRRIALQLEDVNAQLTFRVVNHNTAGYKRPAEDDYHRIDWLLGGLLSTVHDYGLVDRDPTTNVSMSAVDYTGQTPDQVLQDCSDLSGKNYFLYHDTTTGLRGLAYFKSTNASFFPSGKFISSAPGDIGAANTYSPLKTPVLNRDPSQVFNGAMMDYSGGKIYLQHGTDLPLIRDTVIASSNTSSRTHATALVQKYLAAAALERETVDVTIPVPAANINDLIAGMLVTCTFPEFDGWSVLPVRILQRSISTEMTDQFYNVTLSLGHPKLVSFGGGGSNSQVWPSQQPPFVPGTGGGTPTYVQSAKAQNASGTSPQVVTLGAAPTAGNFLGIYVGQVQSSVTVDVTLPAGWSINDIYVPPGGAAPAANCQMLLASKIADGTETSVSVSWTGTGPLEVFYFEYSGATGYGAFAHGQQAASATFTLPSVTPTPSLPTAVLAFLNWDPDYTVVSPLANTRQFQTRSGWAARAAQSYSDTIIANPAGSYSGTTSGSVGAETGYAAIVTWLTGGSLDVPSIGQPVAPESRTGDGSKAIYTTNYPYQPGSLVVKVNGIIVAVAETDPTTGTFTLPAPPAVGAIITWTYNVADPTPTGANNPQAPAPSGTTVPPAPGTMPGGDGINRQPQLSFVPAETPDGVRTVFTIPPYVAGTTLVYINGLIQRITTDYAETSPGTGVITFTTAPWTGANIVVVAMPYLAAPPPTGTRNVTWAAPVTTATYTITPGQFAASPTDVSAAMNAYLLTVPDGSIIQWPVAGDFTLSQGIQLSNRHNLILNGRGTTLRVQAGAGGNNQLASSIITGHAYGGSWTLGATDIQIHDFTLVGNNPTPGVFTSGTEAQANLELTGCTRLEVYNITGSGAWGDFIFVEDITDGWFHNNTGTNAGRNGVSVISGNRVLVESNAFTTCGYNTLDVEPANSTQACTAITIRNNTAATWSNAFLGIEGSHTGAPIHTVTVSGNSITGKSLLSICSNGGVGAHMTNISVTNNTSTAAAVAGPVLQFGYTDNVTASGNTQPLSSGSLVSTTSCSNVVL